MSFSLQRKDAERQTDAKRRRTSNGKALRYGLATAAAFHSRDIYRCGARRASVEESENSMRAAAYSNTNGPGMQETGERVRTGCGDTAFHFLCAS